MLERVTVILSVVVKLIRVSEEIAAGAEGIAAADIRAGQAYALGLLYGEDVLRTAIEGLTDLIADIRVGVLICHYLHGVLHARRTMIGGKH